MALLGEPAVAPNDILGRELIRAARFTGRLDFRSAWHRQLGPGAGEGVNLETR